MALTKDDIQRAMDCTQPYSRYQDLGLFHFWKKAFPDVFNQPYSRSHYRIVKTMLEMYKPEHLSRHDRQRYVIIHRECGKSTFVTFAWPLTMILFKGFPMWVRYDKPGWEGSDVHDYDIVELPPFNENFILIASETATRSENFVTDIKQVLETRPDLNTLFGPKDPSFVVVEEDGEQLTSKRSEMWRAKAFRTADDTTVWGIGSGQQTRGIKVNNRRPTLVLVDDMYSRKNTKTDVTREGLKYWFDAELSNTADTVVGKILWTGTIVHQETVPIDMQSSDLWSGIKIPVIGQYELDKALAQCKKTDRTIEMPPQEIIEKLQFEFKTLSWPERHSLRNILLMYKANYEKGTLGYFYQEYLNIAIAPEEVKFNIEDFVPIDPREDFYYGQKCLSFDYQERTWYALPKWYYGADLASSDSAKADETCLFVGGILRLVSAPDQYGRRQHKTMPVIAKIEHGRGWDVYEDLDKNKHRKGIATEIMRSLPQLPSKDFTIDARSTQELIVREIEKHLRDSNIQCIVNHHLHQENKADFILSVWEPLVQVYKQVLYFRNLSDKIHKLVGQLMNLGTKAHDDIPDAGSMCFLDSRPGPILLTGNENVLTTPRGSELIPHTSTEPKSVMSLPPGKAWEVF